MNAHRMKVTVRPICYFDLRSEVLPEWWGQADRAGDTVGVLVDEAPRPGCLEITGELLKRTESADLADGRVLVVGMLSEIRLPQ